MFIERYLIRREIRQLCRTLKNPPEELRPHTDKDSSGFFLQPFGKLTQIRAFELLKKLCSDSEPSADFDDLKKSLRDLSPSELATTLRLALRAHPLWRARVTDEDRVHIQRLVDSSLIQSRLVWIVGSLLLGFALIGLGLVGFNLLKVSSLNKAAADMVESAEAEFNNQRKTLRRLIDESQQTVDTLKGQRLAIERKLNNPNSDYAVAIKGLRGATQKVNLDLGVWENERTTWHNALKNKTEFIDKSATKADMALSRIQDIQRKVDGAIAKVKTIGTLISQVNATKSRIDTIKQSADTIAKSLNTDSEKLVTALASVSELEGKLAKAQTNWQNENGRITKLLTTFETDTEAARTRISAYTESAGRDASAILSRVKAVEDAASRVDSPAKEIENALIELRKNVAKLQGDVKLVDITLGTAREIIAMVAGRRAEVDKTLEKLLLDRDTTTLAETLRVIQADKALWWLMIAVVVLLLVSLIALGLAIAAFKKKA